MYQSNENFNNEHQQLINNTENSVDFKKNESNNLKKNKFKIILIISAIVLMLVLIGIILKKIELFNSSNSYGEKENDNNTALDKDQIIDASENEDFVNKTINQNVIECTYDRELIQGAEYINGQYVYKYMQHYDGSWENMDIEGWGVKLIDSESTEAVTTKLCTYINNKPIVSTSYMFLGSSAESIDFSSFNTSNVVYMKGMFANVKTPSLDLGSFDTSKVRDMSLMFMYCKSKSINLNNFDTSNVTNMLMMFSDTKTSSLDFSSFNTSNVKIMEKMFKNSNILEVNLSSFDTTNVTYMDEMFENSKIKTLDLSNFDLIKVDKVSNMFKDSEISTVYVKNQEVINKINSNDNDIKFIIKQ